MVDDPRVVRLIEEALAEDIGKGDLTTESVVPEGSQGRAEVILKQRAMVAGLEVCGLVFHTVDEGIRFVPRAAEGVILEPGTVVAEVAGSIKSILTAERVALNILQRMSGIATRTKLFVEAVAGTWARITDTRKTAPGLRLLDKFAVRIGGGINHRSRLDEMILVKDNHIAAAGGVASAIKAVLAAIERGNLTIPLEVEVKNLDDLREVLRFKAVRRILLDNFPISDLKNAVSVVNGRAELEASGGITLETVRSVAETGVDFISVGALTHSVAAVDLSLKLRE
ncbi:MAG TPA: carboxylating nicotinate-nucleotide diphosphorylase [Bacteroidota bacterium]